MTEDIKCRELAGSVKVKLTASRFMMVCPVSLKMDSRNRTLTKGHGYTGKKTKQATIGEKD